METLTPKVKMLIIFLGIYAYLHIRTNIHYIICMTYNMYKTYNILYILCTKLCKRCISPLPGFRAPCLTKPCNCIALHPSGTFLFTLSASFGTKYPVFVEKCSFAMNSLFSNINSELETVTKNENSTTSFNAQILKQNKNFVVRITLIFVRNSQNFKLILVYSKIAIIT